MEILTESVNQLQLELVDEEWVRNIIDSEYLEVAELSPIYESALSDINVSIVLVNIINNVTLWLQDDSDPGELKSWTKLKKHIKCKKVLAVLCYFMDRGTKDVLVKEYRDIAILAARVYFKFMSIAAYKAHDVYHSQLFVHSLACLSYPRHMLEFDHSVGRVQEVNAFLHQINEYVAELHMVIFTLNLRPGDINYNEILDSLLEVTGGGAATRRGADQTQCTRIINAVYDMLDFLMKDVDGRPCSAAIRQLFETMLPKLLAMCNDHNAVNLVQNHYISFIQVLLRHYKESCLDSLYILLQHLCYTLESLEKNDMRSSRASLVLQLMSLLPKKLYCKFINWVLKMTCYSNVMHRHLALELLGKVLEECNYESLQELNESQESGISSDANISDSGESSQGDIQNMTLASVRRTPSSGVESQEIEEEHHTNRSLTDNQQTLKYADILATFEECLDDVNCSVRMRALSLLTKCATSRKPQLRRAAEEFDKSGTGKRLMSIAVLMCNDERAMVKRAALDLLLQLIREGDTDEESLKMLVNLCRDASVQVRSATISALTGHCMSNPELAVMDAFVSGPLHQLSDPEVRIQDQVITSLKQIVFDTLRPYRRTDTNSQAWMLIETITRRNKRKYLENACAMTVAKFRCINSRLIDVLGTHLGKYVPPDRSLHALVLLSCAGKYVNHTNVDFLIQHFYSLGNSQKNDCREIVMCLELLSVWSDNIQEAERINLRSYIIRGVENGTLGDHGSRPSCLTFASQLDRDNLQWVTEHMKNLLQRADDDSPASLLAELADLSLVSPSKPPQIITNLLMRKLDQTDLDPTSSGIVVASIGRMCVRSYAVCCRVAPALGEVLLRRDGPLPPRINALSVLEDICSKHSGIVEPLMETICTCLEKEAPVLLRRTATRVITMLLLKQFLKLRTPLYYYYCALAIDTDTEIRDLCLNYVLYQVEPKVILNHFVDGVLYYNNSGPHASENYNYMDETTRRKLYDLLLSRLSDQQRLQVVCRLGTQVLSYGAEVCDEQSSVETSLSEEMESAILDAITLIYQLKNKRGKATATEQLDEEDDLREQTAEHSAMSPKMRRALADSLVPGVVNIHSRLISTNSSLVEPLTRLGKDLLRDFKNEVDEFLSKGDALSEQIKQFQEYAEKPPSRRKIDSTPSRVRVHRGARKEAEPTSGSSRTNTNNEFREPDHVPSRNRTTSESREPTAGSSRRKTSTDSYEPTPGTSRGETSTEAYRPTPGPSRKRTSGESREPNAGPSRSSTVSYEPTPGPSRGKTSTDTYRPTPGPSRKRLSRESREPTAGPSRSSTVSYEPTPGPSRGKTSTDTYRPTPGPSRKRLSSESREPTPGPPRSRTGTDPYEPTPRPSRISTGTDSYEPTPGPSRIRTCTDSHEATFGSSRNRSDSESLDPPSGSSTSETSSQNRTNSEYREPPSRSPRKRTSSELCESTAPRDITNSVSREPSGSPKRKTNSENRTNSESLNRTSSHLCKPGSSKNRNSETDPRPGTSKPLFNGIR